MRKLKITNPEPYQGELTSLLKQVHNLSRELGYDHETFAKRLEVVSKYLSQVEHEAALLNTLCADDETEEWVTNLKL